MLSDSGGEHGFGTGHFANLLDDPLGRQQPVFWFVKTERILLSQEVQSLPPGRVVRLVSFCGLVESSEQVSQHVLHVPHNGDFSMADLANFGGINIHVNNFGVRCELAGLPGHPVIKTSTQHNQQI